MASIFQRNHIELNEFLEKYAFTIFQLFFDLSEIDNFELSTFVNGFAFLTLTLVKKLKTRQATFEIDNAFEIYTQILQSVFYLLFLI